MYRLVITKHHHLHLQISGILSQLDLCFASSPSYHYSLKCRKVRHQELRANEVVTSCTYEDLVRYSKNNISARRCWQVKKLVKAWVLCTPFLPLSWTPDVMYMWGCATTALIHAHD